MTPEYQKEQEKGSIHIIQIDFNPKFKGSRKEASSNDHLDQGVK